MLEIVFYLFILWVFIQIFIKILSTPQGALLLLIIPGCLLFIRMNYLWDMFSATQDLFLPNPLCPEGFITDFFADIIGRNFLDKLFGIHFFEPLFTWIIGAIDYVVLLTGTHWLFYLFYLRHLCDSYRWWWLAIVFFFVWLIFFHGMFYLQGFKSIGLDPLARPDKMHQYCPYFSSYYWISMFLSLLYVISDVRKRRF